MIWCAIHKSPEASTGICQVRAWWRDVSDLTEETDHSRECSMVEALLIVKENMPELWKRDYWQCVVTDSGGTVSPLHCTPDTPHVVSQCGWSLARVTFDALASGGEDSQ